MKSRRLCVVRSPRWRVAGAAAWCSRPLPDTRSTTHYSGASVRVEFQVEESGNLTGKFDVWMDVDPEGARGLARTLNQLANEPGKRRLHSPWHMLPQRLNPPRPVQDQLRMLVHHAIHNMAVPAHRLVRRQNVRHLGRRHIAPFDRPVFRV